MWESECHQEFHQARAACTGIAESGPEPTLAFAHEVAPSIAWLAEAIRHHGVATKPWIGYY